MALSPEVCADVVADDEAGGKEEPKYAVEDVVRDELDLGDNHANRHDRPRQLADLQGKIVHVVAGIDKTNAFTRTWRWKTRGRGDVVANDN